MSNKAKLMRRLPILHITKKKKHYLSTPKTQLESQDCNNQCLLHQMQSGGIAQQLVSSFPQDSGQSLLSSYSYPISSQLPSPSPRRCHFPVTHKTRQVSQRTQLMINSNTSAKTWHTSPIVNLVSSYNNIIKFPTQISPAE